MTVVIELKTDATKRHPDFADFRADLLLAIDDAVKRFGLIKVQRISIREREAL